MAWNMKLLLRVTLEDVFACPCNVGKDNLAGLSLSSTGLACNDDRLILLVDDKLLERVFGHHEEMGTWVLHCDATGRCLETTDLGAVVSHFLGKADVEDGKAAVGVDADENGSADLREDLSLILETGLHVEEHRLFTEVVERKEVVFPL